MYRSIETSTWKDPKVKKLDKDEKLLFLYLITNSYAHVSGIYYLSTDVMATESGLSRNRVFQVLTTLSGLGLVRYDQNLEVVWVVNMLRYQGKGSKNDRAAAKQLASFHKCSLINDFLGHYRDRKIPYSAIPLEPTEYPIPQKAYQEQEQEQEQDQDFRKPIAWDRVSFPSDSDTPEARLAVEEWLAYKRRRNQAYKDPEHQVGLLLKRFPLPADFRAAVDFSISNNYEGLFAPSHHGPKPTPPSLARVRCGKPIAPRYLSPHPPGPMAGASCENQDGNQTDNGRST
jgi:hypothetical protein